jgi:dTDP-4-dehydrorhamnose 3,5-epimerase
VIFVPTPLSGAFLIDVEPAADERGSFSRIYCADEFAARGLDAAFVQASLSHNHRKGTLRGMHYQAEPHGEAKLVSCVSGAIHDVIADLRAESPTFGRVFGVVLDASSRRALYIPRGFAHGFQTLTDDAVVEYHMTARYRPEAARGVRWNDPTLRIEWPIGQAIISPRDRGLPRFEELWS